MNSKQTVTLYGRVLTYETLHILLLSPPLVNLFKSPKFFKTEEELSSEVFNILLYKRAEEYLLLLNCSSEM